MGTMDRRGFQKSNFFSSRCVSLHCPHSLLSTRRVGGPCTKSMEKQRGLLGALAVHWCLTHITTWVLMITLPGGASPSLSGGAKVKVVEPEGHGAVADPTALPSCI